MIALQFEIFVISIIRHNNASLHFDNILAQEYWIFCDYEHIQVCLFQQWFKGFSHYLSLNIYFKTMQQILYKKGVRKARPLISCILHFYRAIK